MNFLNRIIKPGSLLTIPSVRQGLVLVIGTTLAYGFDYLFNLVTGRLLDQSEFGVFVALTGVGQVLVVASRVIQTVVTRYIAQFKAKSDNAERAASFFRGMFRISWGWGIVAMGIIFLMSKPLADFLQIDDVRPIWALALATLLMVVRPVVGGALQGEQQFAALGGVQIVQATFRLGFGVALMTVGLGAFGAMSALPASSVIALIYGLFVLDKSFWQTEGPHHGVSLPGLFRFSAHSAVGLIGYAILVNMDAILVKRFFDSVSAGDYGAAITLGKVIQFFPLAIIMILFPKAAQRKAAKRSSADVLLPAIVVVFLICSGVTAVYVLYADIIVNFTVGSSYDVGGRLLGTVGVAMLFLSLANVWLNYFLSIEWPRFVYLIVVANIIQAGLMILFHDELLYLPLIMTFSGFWLTIAGAIAFIRIRED